MRKPVSLETRRELSAAIAERYRAADRLGKKAILDEFVKVTSYHRKHAITTRSGIIVRKGGLSLPGAAPTARTIRRGLSKRTAPSSEN